MPVRRDRSDPPPPSAGRLRAFDPVCLALCLAAFVGLLVLATGAFSPVVGLHEVDWLPFQLDRALELPGVWPDFDVPVHDHYGFHDWPKAGPTGRILAGGLLVAVLLTSFSRRHISFERVSLVSASIAVFAYACLAAACHDVANSLAWYVPPFSPWRSFPPELRLTVSLLLVSAVGGLVGAARAWRHPTTSPALGLSTATVSAFGLWVLATIFATHGATLPAPHPPLDDLPAATNAEPWFMDVPYVRLTVTDDREWQASIHPEHRTLIRYNDDALDPVTWPARSDRESVLVDLDHALTEYRPQLLPEADGRIVILLSAQAGTSLGDVQDFVRAVHAIPNALLFVEVAPRRVGTVPFALRWIAVDGQDRPDSLRLVANADETKPPHAVVGNVVYANAGDAVRAHIDAFETASLIASNDLRWADVLHALDALPTEDVELSSD